MFIFGVIFIFEIVSIFGVWPSSACLKIMTTGLSQFKHHYRLRLYLLLQFDIFFPSKTNLFASSTLMPSDRSFIDKSYRLGVEGETMTGRWWEVITNITYYNEKCEKRLLQLLRQQGQGLYYINIFSLNYKLYKYLMLHHVILLGWLAFCRPPANSKANQLNYWNLFKMVQTTYL